MQVGQTKLTVQDAERIYDVLVTECQASEYMRHPFISQMTSPEHTWEWRFQGSLGFGGKFWDANGKFYVTCYPEDETPERRAAIKRTNKRLAALYREIVEASPTPGVREEL